MDSSKTMHYTNSGSAFNGFYIHCTGACCVSGNKSLEVSTSGQPKIAYFCSGGRAEKPLPPIQHTGQPRLLLQDREGFIAFCKERDSALRKTESSWAAWRRKNSTIVRPPSAISDEAEEMAWISACFVMNKRGELINGKIRPPTTRKEDFICDLQAKIEHCILRTKMEKSTIYGALVLLQRAFDCMQSCTRLPFPDTTNFGLFVCASIISHRFLVDETYSLSSWAKTTKNEFCTQDINKVMSEMLAVVGWKVTITTKDLRAMSRELEATKNYL